MKKVNIGILGLGNVGTGTYQILEMNSEKIAITTGKEISISSILVNDKNKKRNIDIPASILTENPRDILGNPDIDIVVELLGGIHPAFDYMLDALNNGKHVVTANKAVIATHGNELREAAKKNNVMLKYEASVAGGIPVINALSEALASNEFDELVGIVNGTTNYILTQMTDYGSDYDDVLKKAQELGFAEADPTSDVEGEDVAYKLSILMKIAFGIDIAPKDIPTEGISKISNEDIAYASQFDYKIKLLATAKRHPDNRLECHVKPTLIPISHALASVNNEFNALFVKGNAVGELMFYGKGAGSMPTGSAVVSDMIEIAKAIGYDDRCTESAKITQTSSAKVIGEGSGMYYINFLVEDKPGVLGKVSTAFGDFGISIDSVMQRAKATECVPLIYILHEAERAQLDKCLEVICRYDFIKEVKSILRVEQFQV